ncbi:MAG: hypothetical protein K2X91_07130, partial [Thermoleophilia bacterium]|nr:hypothetical protein [Thermoleophilia bacterium]
MGGRADRSRSRGGDRRVPGERLSRGCERRGLGHGPGGALTAPVALITGTGLYALDDLEGERAREVVTPHGRVTVTEGALDGTPVAHLPRHGAGHARLSHQVDPRANVAAVAALGARCLVSTTVCGAVDPSLDLGSLVVFDDLHFPSNRLADGSLCTLFTDPSRALPSTWRTGRPTRSVR